MPYAMLLPLIVSFAASMATCAVALGRSAREGRPPDAAELATLNLLGIALTLVLLGDRSWRARWAKLEEAAPGLFQRLTDRDPKKPLDHVGFPAEIPREPPHLSLTEPDSEKWMSYPKERHAWARQPDAADYLVTHVLRRLAVFREEGATLGRTNYAVHWIHWGGEDPVRFVRSRRPRANEPPVYTFRKSRGRWLHLVVAIRVRDEPDRLTVWWEAGVQRATPRDIVRRMWAPVLFLAAGAAGVRAPAFFLPAVLLLANPTRMETYTSVMAVAVQGILAAGAIGLFVMPGLLQVRVPAVALLGLAWLHAVVVYPPWRGWTSLWAQATRERDLSSQAGKAALDVDQRHGAKAFLDAVEKEMRALQSGRFT